MKQRIPSAIQHGKALWQNALAGLALIQQKFKPSVFMYPLCGYVIGTLLLVFTTSLLVPLGIVSKEAIVLALVTWAAGYALAVQMSSKVITYTQEVARESLDTSLEVLKSREGYRMRIKEAVALAMECGGVDGSHHKMWVIDQMVRILLKDQYEEFVRRARAGEDGPDTYDWDEGIAP